MTPSMEQEFGQERLNKMLVEKSKGSLSPTGIQGVAKLLTFGTDRSVFTG